MEYITAAEAARRLGLSGDYAAELAKKEPSERKLLADQAGAVLGGRFQCRSGRRFYPLKAK